MGHKGALWSRVRNRGGVRRSLERDATAVRTWSSERWPGKILFNEMLQILGWYTYGL